MCSCLRSREKNVGDSSAGRTCVCRRQAHQRGADCVHVAAHGCQVGVRPVPPWGHPRRVEGALDAAVEEYEILVVPGWVKEGGAAVCKCV